MYRLRLISHTCLTWSFKICGLACMLSLSTKICGLDGEGAHLKDSQSFWSTPYHAYLRNAPIGGPFNCLFSSATTTSWVESWVSRVPAIWPSLASSHSHSCSHLAYLTQCQVWSVISSVKGNMRRPSDMLRSAMFTVWALWSWYVSLFFLSSTWSSKFSSRTPSKQPNSTTVSCLSISL